MSNDDQAFDADISTRDSTLFTPLLQEDLTKLPPPFNITNPLNKSDFLEHNDNDKAHNSFLNNLISLEEYFEQGYSEKPNRNLALTINRSQFI